MRRAVLLCILRKQRQGAGLWKHWVRTDGPVRKDLTAPPIPLAVRMEEPVDLATMRMQRDSLRDALEKVLKANEREALSFMSYQNAHDNFSSSAAEQKAHELAMLDANEAELEARLLLLTMRDEA